jgi:response regulator RpfG family c-di-GMP phosphodiesterase
MREQPVKVLCVDDETAVLKALVRELRPDGYEVLLAECGEEAMRIVKQGGVAVAISDEQMPGMGGVTLLQWIKEASPATVRIMLTAHYADPDVTIPAINCAGVFWFLAKPWDGEELRAVVKEAVEKHVAACAHAHS